MLVSGIESELFIIPSYRYRIVYSSLPFNKWENFFCNFIKKITKKIFLSLLLNLIKFYFSSKISKDFYRNIGTDIENLKTFIYWVLTNVEQSVAKLRLCVTMRWRFCRCLMGWLISNVKLYPLSIQEIDGKSIIGKIRRAIAKLTIITWIDFGFCEYGKHVGPRVFWF